MTSQFSELSDLGWTHFFNSQLDPEERTATVPVRVMAVHRSGLIVKGEGVEQSIPPFATEDDDQDAIATIGDWLLIDRVKLRPLRLLNRKSLFKR